MSRFFTFILLSLLCPLFMSAAVNDFISLTFPVKDAQLGIALPEARIVPYDSLGNPLDTVKARVYSRLDRDLTTRIVTTYLLVRVPRKEGVYTFDVMCPHYETQTVTARLDKGLLKEDGIDRPAVLMRRETQKLDEVTVTTSKIKFYHKGDTLVYNADAFELAEGSMLDALIAQLPGVELKEGGRITVNGEYVETLLLNGREFFNENRQLMLENIGAYTVKNVQVYRGQTIEEKWRDDPNVERHLTMDVALKKEYSTGLTVNAQGGYGTHGRYMGRLFGAWFSPTTRVSVIANVNNLNDNRKPGKDDSWTPDIMPSGTHEYRTYALNYSYRPLTETLESTGDIDISQSIFDSRTTTSRTNFLPGSNTYDYVFSKSRSNNLRINATHRFQSFSLDNKRMRLGLFAKGGYRRDSAHSSRLSGTFREEQDSVTRDMLDAIYASGTPEALDALINRSGTRSDGLTKEWNVELFPFVEWKIPGTKLRVSYEPGFKYNSKKEDRWNEYLINYGNNPVAATHRRQFTDNSPNDRFSSIHNFTFTAMMRGVTLSVNYEYRFENTNRDSYMYALERLGEDMGVYGTVPTAYLNAFDPDNSYRSRIMLNRHTLSPTLSWLYLNRSNLSRWDIYFRPQVSVQHRHMDYMRAGREYPVKRTSMLAALPAPGLQVGYSWGYESKDKNGRMPRNKIVLSSRLDTKTPDLNHMIDIVNDADPLNIALGNPNLRNSYSLQNNLRWQYNLLSRHFINTVSLMSTNIFDELVRGYTYESATGIRRNRTYNVNGNSSWAFNESFQYQFGRRDQFTLSYIGSATLSRSADMIGENSIEPVRSTADNRFIAQTLRFGYTIGRQALTLKGSWTGRHTTSDRAGFRTLDADNLSAGLLGQFDLTHGFGLSTDFTVYRRSGYGMSEIDTTDPIWNMRLTYTPAGGRWVIMADGFDLLHRLTNVSYAVTATGRTVAYSNALPHYFMFMVQYRFNRQPRGRR